MIRLRKPGDDEAIVELVRTELVPLSTSHRLRERQLRRDMATRLQRGSTFVAARWPGGEPFGFVHVEVRNSVLFVDLLAVSASKQNRSWGTELMRCAEDYGVRNGCTEARLFVDDTNFRGLRFYGKLGYAVVGQISGLRCYELFKPLGEGWG